MKNEFTKFGGLGSFSIVFLWRNDETAKAGKFLGVGVGGPDFAVVHFQHPRCRQKSEDDLFI